MNNEPLPKEEIFRIIIIVLLLIMTGLVDSAILGCLILAIAVLVVCS